MDSVNVARVLEANRAYQRYYNMALRIFDQAVALGQTNAAVFRNGIAAANRAGRNVRALEIQRMQQGTQQQRGM